MVAQPSDYAFQELIEAHMSETGINPMVGFSLDQFKQIIETLPGAASQRFVPPMARAWFSFPVSPNLFNALFINPLLYSHANVVGATYKGLITLKTPFDLALYPRLFWELRPRTLIEFGPFQGGSSLWFAEHLELMCPEGADVHAFEYVMKGISRRAKHPRLQFHPVDLQNLDTLDVNLLKTFRHPWVVVDDAHVNVPKVFSKVAALMEKGDYYIIEDVSIEAISKELLSCFEEAESMGFKVDTYYTDAFGYNMTCAPNAWLRKC